VHFVYIARCADGTLYTGYALDPAGRIATHNAGRGAKYTAGRRPVELVYAQSCATHADALRRERAIKRLNRSRKDALVAAHTAAATPS
jgi:putative endonuclease